MILETSSVLCPSLDRIKILFENRDDSLSTLHDDRLIAFNLKWIEIISDNLLD